MRHLAPRLLLGLLCWSGLSLRSGAQELGKLAQTQSAAEKEKPATKKTLSDDQFTHLKWAHYEVKVTRKTYRPYIIDSAGEKLIQLEYDTRAEAEARIREAKKDNEILEPPWRDKDFGIETIEHTSMVTIGSGALEEAAKTLADDEKYKPEQDTTHCSEFVRDYARKLLGRDVPELRGPAGAQADQLKAAAGDPKSKWWSLAFHEDPAAALQRAQELADEGKLVVVAWKNPTPTATDSGHVAVIVPRRGDDAELPYSTTWKLRVPYSAQAGATVSSYQRLSQGFAAAKKSGLELYVLEP